MISPWNLPNSWRTHTGEGVEIGRGGRRAIVSWALNQRLRGASEYCSQISALGLCVTQLWGCISFSWGFFLRPIHIHFKPSEWPMVTTQPPAAVLTSLGTSNKLFWLSALPLPPLEEEAYNQHSNPQTSQGNCEGGGIKYKYLPSSIASSP